jgi:hypothetical protein
MEAEWKTEGVWLEGRYISRAETRHDAAKAVDEMVNALMQLRRELNGESPNPYGPGNGPVT